MSMVLGFMRPYRSHLDWYLPGRSFRATRFRVSSSLNQTQQNELRICTYIASIAVLLGIITLLLVGVAQDSDYRAASWIYSTLAVISGLCFVVFGPLLLCRFFMHAYYRKLRARLLRMQTMDAETQAGGPISVTVTQAPNVYTCIVVTPEDDQIAPHTNRSSTLPTYEQAVGNVDVYKTINDQPKPPCCASFHTSLSNAESSSHRQEQTNLTDEGRTTCASAAAGAKEDSPPPTYGEALKVIHQHQSTQEGHCTSAE